jgi:hypothetical protein
MRTHTVCLLIPVEAKVRWDDSNKKWEVEEAQCPPLSAMTDIYNRECGGEILPTES